MTCLKIALNCLLCDKTAYLTTPSTLRHHLRHNIFSNNIKRHENTAKSIVVLKSPAVAKQKSLMDYFICNI